MISCQLAKQGWALFGRGRHPGKARNRWVTFQTQEGEREKMLTLPVPGEHFSLVSSSLSGATSPPSACPLHLTHSRNTADAP